MIFIWKITSSRILDILMKTLRNQRFSLYGILVEMSVPAEMVHSLKQSFHKIHMNVRLIICFVYKIPTIIRKKCLVVSVLNP